VEGVILIFVALGALLAFGAGIVLLVLYFRSGRDHQYERQELVRYGNLVQCPRCGYMNPADSAACLNCRLPFTHGQRPVVPVAAPNNPTIPPTAYQPPPVRPTPPPSYAPPPASGATVKRTLPTPPPPEAQQTAPAPSAPTGTPADAAQPTTEQLGAWLEGKTGALANQRIMLTQADTMIGRSTSCDVQIYDPKVSRKHFLIRFGNGAFFLQDQDSSRGTFINGERVLAQRLNDGDRIDLGDTSLVFHVE
jgi:pSer/pThr/pTyr-binding forkhead associated (FHA) protein